MHDPLRRDDLEAAALYELLGGQVAPLFYERGADGCPSQWLAMVRHTLASLGPKVQASRMVREYVESQYTPAATAVELARVRTTSARPAGSPSTATGSAGRGRTCGSPTAS